MSRPLDEKETNYVLNITEPMIDKKLLLKLFAYTSGGDSMFRPNDTFMLPKGHYFNETDVSTTVGKYIFNLYVIIPDIAKSIGYQNEVTTNGYINKLEDKLSELLLEDIINPIIFIEYIDRIQWLGFGTADFMTNSISMNFIKPNEVVQKRKKELYQEHKGKLDAGDAVQATLIEDELVKLATEELKNDPSYDNYKSGAKTKMGKYCSFKNLLIAGNTLCKLASIIIIDQRLLGYK